MMQIGGVYTTFSQEESMLFQTHRDRNGRRITFLFKCIGVRGRFDSPDKIGESSRGNTMSSNKTESV